MPGKYPTINSPLTTRSTIVPGTAAAPSRSDKNTLRVMFPNSPIYSLNETDYRAIAAGYLQPPLQAGDESTWGAALVDLNFSGSPNLTTPPSGFDSSYYPNLIANSDPAGGEGTATGILVSANDNYGTGSPADTFGPIDTALIINQQTIAVTGPIAPLGESGANLVDGGSVSTHDVTPGASGTTSA